MGEAQWEAEHWQQLQALFHLCEGVAPSERRAILEQATADRALSERALALLAAADEEPGPPAEAAGPLPGRTVGPYRLLRHLGTGGLGSVYLAERLLGPTVLRCALKVLNTAAAGPGFEERFAREGQILAQLSHPGITRMLDAGWSDTAQPYLAMEYVEGVDVATFCDSRRLTVAERLRVFLQMCAAVAYAHRALTVHLDLKPSNVLVTESGAVKLLDFGTSKLVEAGGAPTTTVFATPAYASPEQLRGEPVTTACDVYGLGAVLYELLAGRRPFGQSSVAVLLDHALRGGEPPRLTAELSEGAAAARGLTAQRLHGLLQGDLAAVVARCLQARPAERYPSVDALAEDVERYLGGHPVLARRQTTLYRAGKFVRRHRWPLAGAATAALAVGASLGYAAWRQEQAVREAARAVAMQSFMSHLFKLANTHYMGKPAATVPEFLTLGATVLPQMISHPADLRASQLSLAESMYNNTDYAPAEALLQQVVGEARRAEDTPVLAEAEGYLGITEYHLNKLPLQKQYAEDALRLAHARGVPPEARVWIESFYELPRYDEDYTDDNDVRLQTEAVKEAHGARGVSENELAYAELTLGMVLEKKDRWREEAALVEQAMAIYSREPYAVCDSANAGEMLGLVRQQLNDLQGSVEALRTGYEQSARCAGPDNRDTLEMAGYLGLAMVAAKQTREAIPLLEATIPKLSAVAGPAYMGLRGPLLALARSYVAQGQFAKGEATAERLVDLAKDKVKPLSPQMGAYQTVWARALAGEGRTGEALAHAELADQAYQAAVSGLPAIRDNAALTHQLLLDLRAKVAAARTATAPRP